MRLRDAKFSWPKFSWPKFSWPLSPVGPARPLGSGRTSGTGRCNGLEWWTRRRCIVTCGRNGARRYCPPCAPPCPPNPIGRRRKRFRLMARLLDRVASLAMTTGWGGQRRARDVNDQTWCAARRAHHLSARSNADWWARRARKHGKPRSVAGAPLPTLRI